jgi:hypothetical protein
LSRIFLSLPFLAAAVWTLIDREHWPIRETWPALFALWVVTMIGTRSGVRMTSGELVIRYPIAAQRLPRAEVKSAKFNYFGLVVHMRDGRSKFALLAPELKSTELSRGGEPEPGSAAYEITRWAQLTDHNDRPHRPSPDEGS